jgi:hypothetical protein
MRPTTWDDEVRGELEELVLRRPQVNIRILTGPVIGTHPAGENAVLDWYLPSGQEKTSIEVRTLSWYPAKCQGRLSDRDLYIELSDSPTATGRAIRAHDLSLSDEEEHGPIVSAWLLQFEELWMAGDPAGPWTSREPMSLRSYPGA